MRERQKKTLFRGCTGQRSGFDTAAVIAGRHVAVDVDGQEVLRMKHAHVVGADGIEKLAEVRGEGVVEEIHRSKLAPERRLPVDLATHHHTVAAEAAARQQHR